MIETEVIGQEQLILETGRIFSIFKESNAVLRPHFILTGKSGSGKSWTIANLAKEYDLNFVEINAAQLTKEGTSGNSLSKALVPISRTEGKPTICFVDEFDKLFISGNSNDSSAHESTVGVQNEFLKVLESDQTSIFGDYGKYIDVPIKNVLFIFAGAFNGEEDLTIDRLREIGLKTEFLGRVGLVYNTKPLTLESCYKILENSDLLKTYAELFEDTIIEDVILEIKKHLKDSFEKNTLGARLINTLIHQYFIKGGLDKIEDVEKITFKTKLKL